MTWQSILAQGFSSANALLTFLDLPTTSLHDEAEQQFATRVPLGFAQRMQRGNPNDPLLLQVLARSREMQKLKGYVNDPLVESAVNPHPGLLHKYHGRVLLTLTGACAINCRYCFRRHFPYQQNNPGRAGWKHVMDYIKKDNSIHEVILSGGDPLLATDRVWEELLMQLENIPHIKTLRIHTRIPIVLPARITTSFLDILAETKLHKVVVFHCNHAQEINHEVGDVADLLRTAGCHLLNQSVLLKGVNDCPELLTSLSFALFNAGILPYYLHMLDKVQGAAHFDLPEEKVLAIYKILQTRLPGYLLPRLTREDPGGKNKTLVVPRQASSL